MQMLYIFYNTCIIFEFLDSILHTCSHFQFIFIELFVQEEIKIIINNNALNMALSTSLMLIYKYFQPTRCTWQAKNVNNFPSHWIKFSAGRLWFETTDIYVHSIWQFRDHGIGIILIQSRQYHEDVRCAYECTR